MSSTLDLFFFVSVGTPSAPRSINPLFNDTTLTLEWSEPLDNGDRKDLSYTIKCSVCRSSKCIPCGDSVSYRPAHEGLLGRRVEVWGLLPHTTYTFTVQALNGVSLLSSKEPASESVNITTSHNGERRKGSGRKVEAVRISGIYNSSAMCAVPSLVSVIRKSDSTESSLTLHWSVPSQPEYTILQYQLRYCEKVRTP